MSFGIDFERGTRQMSLPQPIDLCQYRTVLIIATAWCRLTTISARKQYALIMVVAVLSSDAAPLLMPSLPSFPSLITISIIAAQAALQHITFQHITSRHDTTLPDTTRHDTAPHTSSPFNIVFSKNRTNKRTTRNAEQQ